MHQRCAGRQHVHTLLRRHALITLAKAFTGDEDEIDFVCLRIYRPAYAFFVEGKCDVADILVAFETPKHRAAIRHFRHRLGRYEGPRFHPPDAASLEPRNEFQLLVCAQISRIILQAVARADLHNINSSCHQACLAGIDWE